MGKVEGIYAGANDSMCLNLKEGSKGGVRGMCASPPTPAERKELFQPQSKFDVSATGRSP